MEQTLKRYIMDGVSRGRKAQSSWWITDVDTWITKTDPCYQESVHNVYGGR